MFRRSSLVCEIELGYNQWFNGLVTAISGGRRTVRDPADRSGPDGAGPGPAHGRRGAAVAEPQHAPNGPLPSPTAGLSTTFEADDLYKRRPS